jgi:AcrR family transcriptional regulator
MARPVNANAEETKQRILDSASKLYAEAGFEGTSVRQIAAAAGVSLGMIRHYFGSKEGLYRACIDSAYAIYGRLPMQIEQGLADGGEPIDVLCHSVREGFRFAVAHRDACRLVLWALMEQDSWRSANTENEMVPFILATARRMAPLLSQSVGNMAMGLRTLVFLVTRYATADHDELALLLAEGKQGVKGDGTTVAAVEGHLVDLTRRLFGAAPVAAS